MDNSVNGLRVLITAGGAGIGRAMTDVFHKAGARIHICDVVQASLDETNYKGVPWRNRDARGCVQSFRCRPTVRRCTRPSRWA